MIDITAVRAATPACKELIHFNNAGASLMPAPVYQAVVDHLALEQNIGGYEAQAQADADLRSFYSGFARLLGTAADEIAFVENATRAWDMAFYGLPLKAGDRIITHASEYVSNYLAFLQQARRRGLHIDVVPSDPSGQIDLSALRRAIGKRTRVVALTHVPSHSGLINPAAEVGEIAREHKLIYLLDACQSVGQLNVDVGQIGCHLLTGTGRKFLRGPRGTGFLYVSNAIIDQLEPPFIDLHSATWTSPQDYTFAAGAQRFENWECNVAGKIGLAKAVAYLLDLGVDAVARRASELAQILRDQLATISDVVVRDRGAQRSAIVTFTHSRESAQDLATRLCAARINISVTPQSSALLDLGERGIDALARASLHYFNTEEEIERFVELVRQV